MLSDTDALHNSSSVARDLFIIFLSSSLLSLYALRLEAVIQTVEANLLCQNRKVSIKLKKIGIIN